MPELIGKNPAPFVSRSLEHAQIKEESMRQYVILIEQGSANLSAYVPSLPGCISTGKTRQEVIVNIYEAIQLRLEGMLEDGESIPDEDLEAVTLVVSEPVAREIASQAS